MQQIFILLIVVASLAGLLAIFPEAPPETAMHGGGISKASSLNR
ncbi:MAG: hypothetical protein OEZ39_19570 [Gammaproteobacteria bacterium]|nr:hypothetical protein [Gammaproteobacteria bacterium]MDH5654066.1 hypothetical protein [Gammaproteobacteria bacterium]